MSPDPSNLTAEEVVSLLVTVGDYHADRIVLIDHYTGRSG